MSYLKQNPKKAFLILAGIMLLVTAIITQSSTIPVSSEGIASKKDNNDFGKASLGFTPETEITPSIDVQVSAAGAFAESGKQIFGWEVEKRWPIASLTKLMTATVALENIPVNDIITITEENVKQEGSSGNFIAGEKFKLNDLIKAMILVSSNDAASALATHFSEEKFMAAMNEKAEELGMNNTYFADSTGLSSKNQSTVSDLVKLTEYIYGTNPQILSVAKKYKDTIVEIKTGKRRTIVNINPLAGGADFLGGKTGSTPEAGGNLISLFNIGGATKTIIVLGAQDRFAETEKIKDSLWQ